MARLTRDEELEQLVRELNDVETAAGETETIRPETAPAVVPQGNELERLLAELVQRRASDLLLIAGNPPILRLAGRLTPTERAPLSSEEVASMFGPFFSGRVRQQMESHGAADFSLHLARTAEESRGWRFRVNLHRQRGTVAAAVRALPTEIPTLAELHLPASLADLVKPTRGLVLVCGPTGSGKTTTLAALVGEINRNESRHVITIEDPIEYEHRNVKSVVEQIEVGRDASSFATALRSALRQDPDVILVGEMRDLETVSIALTAAETGHLILSTLHTADAAQAIHRVVDVFPPAQQNQIKQQLSMSLNAIVIQQLIPRADGRSRVVAVELMIVNNAIRNHIRHEKLQQLSTELTIGKRQGMISFEDSLARLVRAGLISAEEAKIRAAHPDELDSLLRGQ